MAAGGDGGTDDGTWLFDDFNLRWNLTRMKLKKKINFILTNQQRDRENNYCDVIV